MALIETSRRRVQNYLVNAAKTSNKFFKATYDPVTGLANQIDDATPITPTNARCNEATATFGLDPNMGRAQVGRRARWMFTLLLEFPCEVSAELFEQLFLDNIVHLNRTTLLPDLQIELSQAEYTHSVQQNSASGSHLKLAFAVTVGRM